jgi:hypothetical protein
MGGGVGLLDSPGGVQLDEAVRRLLEEAQVAGPRRLGLAQQRAVGGEGPLGHQAGGDGAQGRHQQPGDLVRFEDGRAAEEVPAGQVCAHDGHGAGTRQPAGGALAQQEASAHHQHREDDERRLGLPRGGQRHHQLEPDRADHQAPRHAGVTPGDGEGGAGDQRQQGLLDPVGEGGGPGGDIERRDQRGPHRGEADGHPHPAEGVRGARLWRGAVLLQSSPSQGNDTAGAVRRRPHGPVTAGERDLDGASR